MDGKYVHRMLPNPQHFFRFSQQLTETHLHSWAVRETSIGKLFCPRKKRNMTRQALNLIFFTRNSARKRLGNQVPHESS